MNPSFSFKYNGKEIHSSELVLEAIEGQESCTLEDGLKITVEKECYSEYDAVYWKLNFENIGKKNTGLISDICDCDALLELPEYIPDFSGNCLTDDCAKVVIMKGCIDDRNYWYDDPASATEFAFYNKYLKPSESYSCETESGRSSHDFAPFFRVCQGQKGAIAAIGWSGGWKATFTRDDEGVRIQTGLRNTKFYLKPGEKIRTTSFLIMNYENGEEMAYNQFRRLIKSYFSLPACKNRENDTVLDFELWGGLPAAESIKRLNKLRDKNVGFSHAWFDAGWYGLSKCCEASNQGDWSDYVGHWEINTFPHPNLMKDVKQACDEAGMKMLLWFEPERAIYGTPNTLSHPDWFTRIDKTCLLDLGNDEAWRYVFDMMCSFIDEIGLEAVKYDFNTDPEPFWLLKDEEDRRGISEIKHITGFYRLYDALCEKYPQFLIENCSSGGRRIDIETLSRSVMICRSDYQCQFNANPDVTQTHHTNISCYLPYTGCFTKTKNDTYSLRSAYSNNLGCAYWSALFQNLSDEELDWAKKINEEYKSIRHYFKDDFYNHGSNTIDVTAWAIWQYHSPENKEGMIMAFRRAHSPSDKASVTLKGLKKGASYAFCDIDTNETVTIDFDTLAAHGFDIEIAGKRQSKIITYREI